MVHNASGGRFLAETVLPVKWQSFNLTSLSYYTT